MGSPGSDLWNVGERSAGGSDPGADMNLVAARYWLHDSGCGINDWLGRRGGFAAEQSICRERGWRCV